MMLYNEGIPGALYTYSFIKHFLQKTYNRRNLSTCKCLIRASLRVQYSESDERARFETGDGAMSVRVPAVDAKAWQAWHFSRLEASFGTSAFQETGCSTVTKER